MTTQEMMDNLSGGLLCDERILSLPERELLTHLLQRTKAQANTPGVTVSETVARAVGEIVTERAYGILGESVIRKLLAQPSASLGGPPQNPPGTPGQLPPGPQPPSPGPPSIHAGGPPQTPPGTPGQLPPGPQPPSPGPPSIYAGGPPQNPPGTPGQLPPGPQPPSPGPPSRGISQWQMERADVAVMEAPEFLPAQCVVLDEFLAPAELNELTHYALTREAEFRVSEVVAPGVPAGTVDFEHRRSRVLSDLGKHQAVIVDRLKACLPRVLRRLDHASFPISQVEVQVTASNHGDFFRWHSDNANERVATREITFVYFFHREPRQFTGGELRIYDSRWMNNMYAPTANYRTIVPEQNQMVVFVSALAHEITPVECASRAFADSRFTVNGWLHR